MTTLTFRGHRYQAKTELDLKSPQKLTYRRSVYQTRQINPSPSDDQCLPDGFIRSTKTAELIGVSLQSCDMHNLIYRGVHYVK